MAVSDSSGTAGLPRLLVAVVGSPVGGVPTLVVRRTRAGTRAGALQGELVIL